MSPALSAKTGNLLNRIKGGREGGPFPRNIAIRPTKDFLLLQVLPYFKFNEANNVMSTHAERNLDISVDSAGSGDEGWAEEVESKKDARKQPWKSTFREGVDNQLGQEKDLVRVSSSEGGRKDYPFRVQGNTLAA